MSWPELAQGCAGTTCRVLRAWLFAAMMAGVIFTGAAAQEPLEKEQVVLTTSSGKHEFEVEVAKSREQHSRGLMFRRSLGPRDGMLFVHDKPQYITMWMRNTYIPLDMIFILPDGKVHRIEASAEPLSDRTIDSGDKVTAVLELAGGTAEKIGLKPGNVVRHPHFKAASP